METGHPVTSAIPSSKAFGHTIQPTASTLTNVPTHPLAHGSPLMTLDWYNRKTPNTGAIQLSGLRFSNWTGTVHEGSSRGPIVIRGSNVVPATNITLDNFEMWTETGNEIIHQCRNVYGKGYCARELPSGATPTEFSSSITINSAPTGFVKPGPPAWGNSGYGVTLSIPVYTPAVMWGTPGFGATGGSPTPTPTPMLVRRATHPHAPRLW